MPQISVIIPAYNAEATLIDTVNDVLGQTYKDFEIIIVNDGSTDSTFELCDLLQKKDSRVKVLTQKNGGLSNARNNGIKISEGKYITLVDADDRLENCYLEYLVKAVFNGRVDMSCGRTDRVKEGFVPRNKIDLFKMEIFNSKEAVSEMLTGKKITVGPCNRLVPREWYIENPFIEGAKYEDLSNSYKLHLKANSVAYVDVPIYHYVMRGGSITGAKVVSEKQCVDYFNAIKMCATGVKKVYSDLLSDINVLVARDFLSLYLCIHRCEHRSLKLKKIEVFIRKWIKNNWVTVVKNNKAPINVRLRVVLFWINPYLYRFMYYIGIRVKGKAIA